MLLQISPWEISRTSIRIPSSSRRRKRDSNDAEENKSCPSFAASMITTTSKRSLSRMKVKASEFSDCLPFLTITTDHHITVIGKRLTEAEGSSFYQEFSSLRYNSRPGDAGSFFSSPANGLFSAHIIPHVPAILDTKNDRVYALQQGNSRLTCWDSWKSSGPDEKSALKIYLQHPALSMKLLPMSKGLVYGSCQNGDIYIARVAGEKISVEYIQVEQPKGVVHMGTFAEIEIEGAKTTGRKRKISDAEGISSVNFYQVFCDGAAIKIVRNTVSVSISDADKLIKSGSLTQKTAPLVLINNGELDRVELLVSSSGSTPKICLVYAVRKSSSDKSQRDLEEPCVETFCAAISLMKGQISNNPVRLPSQSKQFGLVSETVLAAASRETLYLYDLITGATLQVNSLKHIRPDMSGDNEWVLHTNDKLGILTIIFPKENYLYVALANATFDSKNVNLRSHKLRSSSKLASSLLKYRNGKFREKFTNVEQVSGIMVERDTNSSNVLIRSDEAVLKALSMLENTRKTIISNSDELNSGISFREVFDACLTDLITYISPRDSCNADLKVQTKKVKNGKSNGRFNTKSKCRKIPTYIPQCFIDGSVQLALSIILEGNKDRNFNSIVKNLVSDARHVLKALIQSKRVSARLHFEGSHALYETGKEHPLSRALKACRDATVDNPMSALQMIVEMIVNCSDLSERHLVVMLDFMMCHAEADGIIDSVRYHNTGTITKDLKFTKDHENKTIIAGVKAVLQMIMGYSECNEALLRVALVEELSSSTEAILLARLLPNLLMASPYGNPAQHYLKSICQWISALSDSFRDDLTWAKTSSGENYLTVLLKSIEKTTKNSQSVISLKDSIGAAEMIKKELCNKGVSEGQQMEEMHGYSIDHIIF